MLQKIINIYNYLGVGTIITICTALLAIIYTAYTFHKNFYRIVYTTTKIKKRYKTNLDWQSEDTDYVTRIIFYNNGKKTITKDNIKRIVVESTGKIAKCEQIITKEIVDLDISNKLINLKFDDLDSGDFILLEVEHKGNISISGRVNETGKILDTETKLWGNISIIALIIFIVLIIYLLWILFFTWDLQGFYNALTSLVSIIIINIFLQVIQSLFFIPNKIVDKYLVPSDESHSDFKYKI